MTTPPLTSAADIEAWRNEHPGQRLNLSRVDLRGTDLGGAYLEGANLEGANLEGANLEGAYLRRADLRWANLEGANLRGIYLGGADLRGANLGGADLRGIYLGGVDLRGTHMGKNRVWQIGPIGSRNDYLVVLQGPNLDIVRTGCFVGTLAEFESAVVNTHGDNQHGRDYKAAIQMCRQIRGSAATKPKKLSVTKRHQRLLDKTEQAIGEAKRAVEELFYDLDEKRSNLEENFSQTKRYSRFEAACGDLEQIISTLEGVEIGIELP